LQAQIDKVEKQPRFEHQDLKRLEISIKSLENIQGDTLKEVRECIDKMRTDVDSKITKIEKEGNQIKINPGF
jgi:hypothetical protein